LGWEDEDSPASEEVGGDRSWDLAGLFPGWGVGGFMYLKKN